MCPGEFSGWLNGSFLWKTHLKDTERHLPYGIAQCYLPLDTGERAPPHTQARDRCRGKFVAPGKFFPPPYCDNVTNANPNPNPKFNPILNLNLNPYCCVWE